jgi:hypothetical protein
MHASKHASKEASKASMDRAHTLVDVGLCLGLAPGRHAEQRAAAREFDGLPDLQADRRGACRRRRLVVGWSVGGVGGSVGRLLLIGRQLLSHVSPRIP